MARVKDQHEAFSHGFATMQRNLRTKVWAAAGKRNPGLRTTAADPLMIDFDASLVHVHFEKEKSAGTHKGGYGFSPMIASVDYGQDNGTGEILAVMMRSGNQTANSAKDHIEVLNQALVQLPDDFYDSHGELISEKILIRTDSAGASRAFLDHLHSRGLQFSTSFAVPVADERLIGWSNEKKYWEPANDQHGNPRHDAGVIDATQVLKLKDYPLGTSFSPRRAPALRSEGQPVRHRWQPGHRLVDQRTAL